jgi:hypothetical protein
MNDGVGGGIRTPRFTDSIKNNAVDNPKLNFLFHRAAQAALLLPVFVSRMLYDVSYNRDSLEVFL